MDFSPRAYLIFSPGANVRTPLIFKNTTIMSLPDITEVFKGIHLTALLDSVNADPLLLFLTTYKLR